MKTMTKTNHRRMGMTTTRTCRASKMTPQGRGKRLWCHRHLINKVRVLVHQRGGERGNDAFKKVKSDTIIRLLPCPVPSTKNPCHHHAH